MDMCILDSNACSEPGRFVFDYSYLTLKITGKRDELNEVRAYLKEKFATRLLHDRLFVFCSADHFRSFINDHRESSDKSFIKDMASLFQSKEIILNLPHSGELLFSKPLIMGVINATDDSFFPGSRVLDEQTLE